MKAAKTYSGAELLERMGMDEILTFDEAMAASAVAQAASGNSLWPTLSGNDIYALANAAAAAAQTKEGPADV